MYMVYFLLCAFGITVMVRVVRIQLVPKAEMKRQSQTRRTDMREIEAARGNIYSDNGSLLATRRMRLPDQRPPPKWSQSHSRRLVMGAASAAPRKRIGHPPELQPAQPT